MNLAIVSLQAADAPRILAHLLRLSPEDRSLRFAAALVTDDTIARYVLNIRYGDDAVIGLVDPRGDLVGLAHGCVFQAHGRTQMEAAFSIDEACRGQGFGHRLMAMLHAHAARHGGATLVGICHARNLPMRRVFQHAGLALTREDDELHARGDVAAEALQLSGRSGKLGALRLAAAAPLA
jgi:GNAT superfamily N-acetyltransferase